MKILVDTNIVLDVLLKRTPFYEDSYIIFQLVEQQRIDGCLSAASITDIFYLLSKNRHNSINLYSIMNELIELFSVAQVSETTIINALALRWKDFEDAVQFIVAKENDVDFIITRNETDYTASEIPCMNPKDFIIHFKAIETPRNKL